LGNKVEIIPWNLEDYANNFNISIEEMDVNYEITETNTVTAKHNTNFEISGEANVGKIKVGTKYGATNELTNSATQTVKWTEGSNQLLTNYSVFFGENVIVAEENLGGGSIKYKFKELHTGSVDIVIRPLQTQ
jgi:hypothetical protein